MSITMQNSFLKWVGGKTRTAGLLTSLAPPSAERYVEPFLGSGAVFFALGPRSALLADLNWDLMVCYEEVRRDPEAVMAALDSMENSREEFLRIRALDPQALSALQVAARVIYLNKTCFRGIWRVNRKGQFNVPYGDYDRPLYNERTMRSAAAALQDADLRNESFEAVLDEVGPGDWVYLDPPYVPAGGYSDFKRYTPGQFHEAEHRVLADWCAEIDRRGAKFLLTNTDSVEARGLYGDFEMVSIPTRRDVNLSSAKRASTDLLVANYEVREALLDQLGPGAERLLAA